MKTLLKVLICTSFLFFVSVNAYSWDQYDEQKYQEFLLDMDDPWQQLWEIA